MRNSLSLSLPPLNLANFSDIFTAQLKTKHEVPFPSSFFSWRPIRALAFDAFIVWFLINAAAAAAAADCLRMGEVPAVMQATQGEQSNNASAVHWERFLPRMVLRVLLVEADDSTRQIISALLHKCSYKGSFLFFFKYVSEGNKNHLSFLLNMFNNRTQVVNSITTFSKIHFSFNEESSVSCFCHSTSNCIFCYPCM